MKHPIKVMAAHRLRAYVSTDAKQLIQNVEQVLRTHGVGRSTEGGVYPRRYIKDAPEALFNKVKRDLESLGFTFHKSALHKPDSKALEAEGKFQSVNYILDLAYIDGRVEVDLHH